MSYKQKFSESSHKAHTRFIATKIYQDMEKHRASVETSPTTPRRWVWELMQNARDVHIDGRVRVRIDADIDARNATVAFSHTGRAFTTENIRFLIEQVSSKERSTDSTGRPQTIGRFGTGFLTTHLLSERVTVQGVVREDGLTPRQFELSLDRSGDEADIIASVEVANQSMNALDGLPAHERYVQGDFNTLFRYELTDKIGKDVARAGLNDLEVCLPYTLAFVGELESVEYSGHLVKLEEPEEERVDGCVQFLSVTSMGADGETATFSLAVLRDDLTTIAIPVERTDGGVRILALGPNVPRLFCDFPLLGTEPFPFPVIINNPLFNPTEPRDGVFLAKTERSGAQSAKNREIIKDAVALYLSLLEHASSNEWHNLHLLADARPIRDLDWADPLWYDTEILKPMRASLLQTKIVRTAAGTIAPVQHPDGRNNILFPSDPNKEIRRRIWRSGSTWFPTHLPAKPDVDAWYELIWPECKELTLDQMAKFIEGTDSVEKLQQALSSKEAAHGWLNEFYATLKLNEPQFLAVVARRRIFPNQNGTFRKKADLTRDAGDIDPELLDILKLLGNDLRDQLLTSDIGILDDLVETNGSSVINQITAAVSKLLNDRSAMDRYRPAISALLLWFHEHKNRARKLFGVLYEQKHRLIDDEAMIENIKHADQLKQLFAKYNVKNVEELTAAIDKQTEGSKLLPVTEKIIASLGITSVEEWRKALEDKDLAAMFAHESTPTTDMFLFAQTLIKEAKDRVVQHLSTRDDYDLADLTETAPTILAGVKHDGRDVQIVVRPAYDGTVIIYYQSERDVLDFEDYELWIDTGNGVRRITLGHILKATEIRRFSI